MGTHVYHAHSLQECPLPHTAAEVAFLDSSVDPDTQSSWDALWGNMVLILINDEVGAFFLSRKENGNSCHLLNTYEEPRTLNLPLWSRYPNHFTMGVCVLLKMFERLSILIRQISKHFTLVPRPWVISFILLSDLIFLFPLFLLPAFSCLSVLSCPRLFWGLLSSCPCPTSLYGWFPHNTWVSTHPHRGGLIGLSNKADCPSLPPESLSISWSCFIFLLSFSQESLKFTSLFLCLCLFGGSTCSKLHHGLFKILCLRPSFVFVEWMNGQLNVEQFLLDHIANVGWARPETQVCLSLFLGY